MDRITPSPWYGLTALFGRMPYGGALFGAWVFTFVAVLLVTQLTTVTPWLLVGCFVSPLFWLVYRGEPLVAVPINSLTVTSTAFLGWAGVTLFWSPGGGEAVASWLRLCVFLAMTLVTRANMGAIDPRATRAIGWSFVAAVGIAIIVAMVDVGWNLAVRRTLMTIFGGARAELGAIVENGRVMHLDRHETNKTMSVLFSLVWPALLIAGVLLPAKMRSGAVTAGAVLFAIAAALSENETVKLALVVSTFAFLIVRWRPSVTRWLLGVGWVSCTLAMLPIVLALTAARSQDITSIQDSGRHRLVIWGFVSREVLKHPVLGSGLASTRQPQSGDAARSVVDLGPTGKGWVAGTTVQPHNNFLQVWSELGGVGAALLCFAGLALVGEIAAAEARIRPYFAAAFAGASVLACLQWTINSSWYIAAFAVTALFMRFGAELLALRDQQSG